MQELRRRFPSYNLTPRLVQRIFKNNRNQDEETSAEEVDLSRKCHEKCGGTNLKLSVEISRKLIELNDKSWGRLSCKKLAGKLREEGFSCSKDSVKRWCQVLGAVRRKRYIKPLQSKRQRCHRLRWVISKYNKRLRKFEDSNDVAHGDEKWFYLLQDGSVCRVFPIFQVNDKGELQSKIKMPASAKVYHKSRQPRVMFLVVTAKLRPEYQFDGKVGNWPFTLTRKAQRSVKKNGTVAGQTYILESVSVTAEEYRKVMLRAGGVFDKMRSKMWWYKCGSGEPKAGRTLYYQHDGASPHTAHANLQHWRRHGNMNGFAIEVVVQPPHSPDLNVNDLAFFSSLQMDTELVAKENVFYSSAAVVEAWEEYPSERRCVPTTARPLAHGHYSASTSASET